MQHWKVFTDYGQGVFFVYLKFCFVFLDLETTWLVEILVKIRTTYLIFREIVCLLILFCVPWTVMRWFPRKLIRMSLYGKRIEDLHCFGKVYRVDQIVNGIVPIIMTKHDQRLVNSGRLGAFIYYVSTFLLLTSTFSRIFFWSLLCAKNVNLQHEKFVKMYFEKDISLFWRTTPFFLKI